MRRNFQILILPFLIVFYEIAIFLSNDMYLPSMPAIAQDLVLTDNQIKATLTAWFLGASSIQVILGPVSDRYGRKIILVMGAGCFILSSLVCAITSDLVTMLLARFFQGLSLCTLVAAYAAVHEIFDTKTAIKILALMGAISILAPALGPLVGALIVQFAGWRDIFWLFVIMGIVAFVSLSWFMPETNFHKHALSFKRVLRDYKSILRNKKFMYPNLAYSFLVGVFFFWMFESPFIIMETYKKSTLYYGVAQTLIFSCFFLGALFTKIWLNSFSVISLIRIATGLSLFSATILWYLGTYHAHMPYIVVSMMFLAFATSMLFGPVNRVAIEACIEPMGRRTAIFSTTISLFGVFSGLLLSFIGESSISTIAALILFCMFSAAALILTIDGNSLQYDH
jgi:DHA1 family multidrug/chloramphenicol efflux transport protein-like MFS transporter